MLRRSTGLSLIAFLALSSPAPAADVEVYRSGQSGYDTFRIPAMIEAANGDLLAFAEGRAGGRGDAGDIDLVLRRSRDGGRTWGDLEVVWNDGGNTCGNPCPVLDRETGAVHLLATRNLGHDHESEIIAGTSEGTRTVWVLTSEDHGATWDPPREITETTKNPNWTWYATGPGNGIQLRSGQNTGRLVIPCDHIESETKHYYSHAIGSDDHGRTWKLLGSTPSHQLNECAVAELEDGSLLLNMRNYDRSKRARAIARSLDGGESWSSVTRDPSLPEPICQASMVAIDDGRTLVFSNPASETDRERMTARRSRDGGRTWSNGLQLHAGPSAYSSLAAIDHPQGVGVVACLYEAGNGHPYESIRFRTIDRTDLGLDVDHGSNTEWKTLLVPGSFEGWHVLPGGTFKWNGNILEGRIEKDDPRHGLLVTDREYGDFEAVLRFRISEGDSGFYFRVEELGDAIGVKGFQAEIDPTPELGGLYETRGRGWVVKPAPAVIESIRRRAGPWLEMRVHAIGGDVDVFIDGVRTAGLRDDPGRRRGRLALQLHANQDVEVDFRSLRIRDLEPMPDEVPSIDGP
ncbi:MAG: exo-alpha-sialidase [Phycisphaerales bacterium]|nr:exo-alpha-sialidase [Phycisphaerales bacterium]